MANIGYMQLVRGCNQYCRFCSNPASGWELDLDTARRQLDDFQKRGYFGVILTGGEPSLSDIVPDVARMATERGLHSRMITNGSRIARPGVAEVPRSVERKSGDALRELFPALFGES